MAAVAATLATLTGRIARSLATFPATDQWKSLALVWGAVIGSLFAGVPAGIYRWQPISDARSVGWTASYMAVRSLLEELIFRAALLPHPKVDKFITKANRWWLPLLNLSAIIPLTLFVASHLWTTQRPPNVVMRDPLFLSTITVLGVVCTWAYWFTHGSLLAAVLTHFVITFSYMALLGGYRKTHTPTPMIKRTPPTARAAMEPSPAPLKAE